MNRLVLALLAGFVATQVWTPAHASTVDYTLTFSANWPYAANTGGTGTFELSGPINTSGDHNDGLTELSMTVDGLTFTLSQDKSATVNFNNGVFDGLSFDGTDTSGRFTFDSLYTLGTSYDLVQDGWMTLSQGDISAVDAPSAAPLPPTLGMFAAGLLLLIGGYAFSRRTAGDYSRTIAWKF